MYIGTTTLTIVAYIYCSTSNCVQLKFLVETDDDWAWEAQFIYPYMNSFFVLLKCNVVYINPR